MAAPTAAWMSGVAPRAAISSSVCPSEVTADERTVRVMVSPVASDAVMIAVPSIRPTTISALRPGRRRALRTPSRKKMRLRSGERRDQRERGRQGGDQRHLEPAHGDAEQLGHDRGLPQTTATAGASATTTSYISRPGADRYRVTNLPTCSA